MTNYFIQIYLLDVPIQKLVMLFLDNKKPLTLC